MSQSTLLFVLKKSDLTPDENLTVLNLSTNPLKPCQLLLFDKIHPVMQIVSILFTNVNFVHNHDIYYWGR